MGEDAGGGFCVRAGAAQKSATARINGLIFILFDPLENLNHSAFRMEM
jgi:hypothetical protein